MRHWTLESRFWLTKRVSLFSICVALNVGCGSSTKAIVIESGGSGDVPGSDGSGGTGGSDGSDGSGAVNGTASFNIVDGETDVSISQVFVATFSAPVSPQTVTSERFFLVPDGDVLCDLSQAIAATVSCSSDKSCELTVSSPLNSGSDYQLCLTSGILFNQPDVDGVFQGYHVGFTTHFAVLASLAISPSNVSLDVADTQQFTVIGTYDDDTTQTITAGLVWSSSDETLVHITQDGLATALELGDTTITVTHTATGLIATATANVDFPIGGVFRYTVGGTLEGLNGSVVLQLNGDDDLTLTANGNFVFDTSIVDGQDYIVTILTQPTEQTCEVTVDRGTIDGTNIDTIVVTCSDNDAVISVTGSPLTVLTNSSSGSLTIHNLSSVVTATSITSNFVGTALDGNITESGNTCGTVAPGATCTLTYSTGSSVVSQTNFTISGSNTNTVTAAATINGTPPTVISISANSGSATGGTGFTITGVSLTGTSAVTFDGTSATSINVVNATTVTGVTPAHAAAAVTVALTTPYGTTSVTNGYTYLTTAVGQSSGGGKIACLDGGLQNLIAATADNSSSIVWGPSSSTGATSTTDGASNTAIIVAAFGDNGGTSYAAQVCNDYEVDSLGHTPCQSNNTCYTDWFLPARDQLSCLYTNRSTIGGFNGTGSNQYWTSREQGSGLVTLVYFTNGGYYGSGPTTPRFLRCVRSFTP